ncbi:MAG: hypothetical protein KGL39_43725, partial [Patescibacteria group bacterium]|nr:hypothetical protein [Patescibacteria group bacterium]
YLPYGLCGAVCRLCDGRVRERTERWAEKKLPLVMADIGRRPKDDPAAVAFEECFHDFDASPGDTVRLHCASVHFQERIMQTTQPEGGASRA